MVPALQILTVTYQYLRKRKNDSIVPPNQRLSWANKVLELLKFRVKVFGAPICEGPVLIVSNHISYIDIPLILSHHGECVFVSKSEVADWPVFGAAARKGETVFVKRSSVESRSSVRQEIKKQLEEANKKIVLFPSGTTSASEEKVWRRGCFEIAHELGIPIQPIRIRYSPTRAVAYIDDDFLPTHLFKLSNQKELSASLEIHPPIFIKNTASEMEYCRSWCNGLNLNWEGATNATF
ncbi:MAG: hypothetical protein RJB66_664 [Pseudomonadota bacterium]|jgi:1-acyl-sn-glycerol-3-phosphate acyltransferase